MDYNVLKELFKIPRRSAGLCKSKKDKIIRKCNNKIKVKFVRLPLGKVLEVSRSCSLESRSWAQHEGGCHWDFAGRALHQQARHDVLSDSLANVHLRRVLILDPALVPSLPQVLQDAQADVMEPVSAGVRGHRGFLAVPPYSDETGADVRAC